MRALALASIGLLGCGASAGAMPSTTPVSVAAVEAPPPRDPCADVPAPEVDLGLTCVAAGADAWIVEVEGVTRAAPHEEGVDGDEDSYDDASPTIQGDYRLVYVRADGTRARSAPRHFAFGNFDGLHLEVFTVYDYDHDGAAELAIMAVVALYEGGDAFPDLLTAPPGATEAVTLPAAVEFAASTDEARDVDGDGVPDLITTWPWEQGGWGFSEGGGGWSGGPRTLRHALPDGSFAMGDAVGQAFWVEECPPVDRLVPPLSADDDGVWDTLGVPMLNVTCAALTSASTAQVTVRLEQEWAAHPCTFDADGCAQLYRDMVDRIADVADVRGEP